MADRLTYYLQQRDQALKQAADDPLEGDPWLRIADEWQKLHDALSRELGHLPPEQPETHLLD
jgi:hypothetical protein